LDLVGAVDDERSLRDDVAGDVDVLAGHARAHRSGGMEAEGLGHDGVQVRHLAEVRRGEGFVADGLVDLGP
jgi:hypothetical protein